MYGPYNAPSPRPLDPPTVILENPALRLNAKAVAVTYVEVVYTTHETLMEILKKYPPEVQGYG